LKSMILVQVPKFSNLLIDHFKIAKLQELAANEPSCLWWIVYYFQPQIF
jgi:hypothetical protein